VIDQEQAKERRMSGFAGLFQSAQKKRAEAKIAPKEEPKIEEEKKRPLPSPSNNARQNTKRRKGEGPSPEVLELSRQLKELSRQKRLDEALALFKKSDITDEHHACILVDCCARCGAVEEAEQIVQNASFVNVEMQTALLKGYAHSGYMHKADSLFHNMCWNSDKKLLPNVRTLNTVLRGCLWTAVSRNHHGKLAGGVITSERIWKLFKKHVGINHVDPSSYEYSITLLCQALRIDEAKERMEDFLNVCNVRMKGKANFVGGNQTDLETIAVIFLALGRAYAIQGQTDETWVACQRTLNAVKGSLAKLGLEQTKDGDKVSSGGKRAWKSQNNDADVNARREASNAAFRKHKLSELEADTRKLLATRKQKGEMSTQILSRRLVTHMLYFSGGGTTDMAAIEAKKKKKTSDGLKETITSSYFSFGLSELVAGPKEQEPNCSQIYRRIMNDEHIFDKHGSLDFDKLFPEIKPIDIELGAGFGDWIVQRAQNDRSRNFLAVELRADRVYQIFCRATLESSPPLDNVCAVGCESGSFLLNSVREASVSNIFVNHPEPPTQVRLQMLLHILYNCVARYEYPVF
jgi:pentatricopeptide repeat protein